MFAFTARKTAKANMDFVFYCTIPDEGNWEKHERLEDKNNRQLREVKINPTCKKKVTVKNI
jgi:hypothetical protein